MNGQPNREHPVPSRRLISTLAVGGAVAGLAIVLVNQWAEPRIQAHRAAALRAAIHEVLAGPASYQTLWVTEGALVAELPAGTDSAALDRVYLGYDESGQPVGFAVAGELPGYQDVIRLIFGYDGARGRLMAMKVLESKETPGLGDRIEKDTSFVAQFDGARDPLVAVKAGSGTGDEHEVDMISGATISSRTVIKIINRRLEELKPLLDRYPAVKRPEVAADETLEAGGGTRRGTGLQRESSR